MVGRPASIYLPLPYCKNGHKRTRRNTRWYDHIMYGKYKYRIARCMICEARAAHKRMWLKKFGGTNSHDRSKVAAQDKAADRQPAS